MADRRFGDSLPQAEEALNALIGISDEHSTSPDDHADVAWYSNITVSLAAVSIAQDVRRIRELLEAKLNGDDRG